MFLGVIHNVQFTELLFWKISRGNEFLIELIAWITYLFIYVLTIAYFNAMIRCFIFGYGDLSVKSIFKSRIKFTHLKSYNFCHEQVFHFSNFQDLYFKKWKVFCVRFLKYKFILSETYYRLWFFPINILLILWS